MRKAPVAFVVVGVLLLAVPVLAQSNSILIEIGGTNRGAEGEIIRVASVDVDPGMVGWLCTGTAQTENNDSENDDNDFILTSGSSSAEILDWEAVAGAVVSMSGTLVLGESITVDLRIGPDRRSSGGVRIVLTCSPPPEPETTTTTSTTTTSTTTTTTAPPETTTTTAPPETTTTTQAPPPGEVTTTEPPPQGGVSAGGGSTAGTSITAAEVLVGAGIAALATALGLVLFLGRQVDSPRD